MRNWTQSEVDFIEDNKHCPNPYLAEKLGRSVEAVKAKKQTIKLDKCAEPRMPEPLTQQEKEIRIIKLAADMRVKLKGWN